MPLYFSSNLVETIRREKWWQHLLCSCQLCLVPCSAPLLGLPFLSMASRSPLWAFLLFLGSDFLGCWANYQFVQSRLFGVHFTYTHLKEKVKPPNRHTQDTQSLWFSSMSKLRWSASSRVRKNSSLYLKGRQSPIQIRSISGPLGLIPK